MEPLPSPILLSFTDSRGLHGRPSSAQVMSGLLSQGGRHSLQARKDHLHHVIAPPCSIGRHRRQLPYLPYIGHRAVRVTVAQRT